MKSMIVCVSVSHGNTRVVADAMGEVLSAPVVHPDHVDLAELAACDLVGFGSGIYFQRFHSELRSFVGSLQSAAHPQAFAFATSGFRPITGPFTRSLERKGFAVLDTFSVRAHDTSFPFNLAGGVNKGRPNDADLAAARGFAERLQARVGAVS